MIGNLCSEKAVKWLMGECHIHRKNTEKVIIHVMGGMVWDSVRFHHAIQKIKQFRCFILLISVLLYVMFSGKSIQKMCKVELHKGDHGNRSQFWRLEVQNHADSHYVFLMFQRRIHSMSLCYLHITSINLWYWEWYINHFNLCPSSSSFPHCILYLNVSLFHKNIGHPKSRMFSS